jgi:hypothetical protein
MATLANAHYVDCDIDGSTSGVDSWTSGTGSTVQTRTTSFPQTRVHLNGEIVQIVRDGLLKADQTVTAGAVTGSGTVNHIGLAYTSIVIPSKLDIEGMGLILTKKITKAVVSFYNTLMGKVGTTSTGTLETVSFLTTLFTGIKEVPLNGGYEREGDIIVKQDEPFPLICRGVILDAGIHDK